MIIRTLVASTAATLLALAAPLKAEAPAPKPGVPAAQRPMTELATAAVIPISKSADWVQITPDATWVAGKHPHLVRKIDPKTNRIVATAELPGNPCAGLAAGFGSIWVPLCGEHAQIARVDARTAKIIAIIDQGPPAEGGIAASRDSIWFTSDAAGTLVRLDPSTDQVRQTVHIAAGSFNPQVSHDLVWVTSITGNLLSAVDARTGKVVTTIPTGPQPRFLTIGGGSVWTLNQGDGTVTRVDERARRSVATIALGIPGAGGDIAFGGGRIWATTIGIPLSAIDAATNQVVGQWVGAGGDSLRYGHGTVWLTDLRGGTVARITPPAKRHD